MIKKICLVLVGFGVTLGVMFVSSKTKTLNEKDIMANNMMALYIEKDGTYEKTNAIPKGDYVLNSSKSKCSNGAIPKWNSNTNSLKLSNLTKDNTSCYLYFNLTESGKTLAKFNLTSNGEVKEFTGPSCYSSSGNCGNKNMNQNGVYEAEDDFGTSYYYRGTVNNNWLVFGQDTINKQYIWWRIIRINGNGTIRLIYAGTSSSNKTAPSTQGVDTMITPRQTISSSYPRAVYFNNPADDNTYVGYRTGGTGKSSFAETHTNASNSTVLDEIVNWYTNNTNLGTLADQFIDVDTGFCGDRQVDKTADTSFQGDGYGTSYTGYAPLGRFINNGSWKKTQTPTLKCGYKSDGSIDKTAQERDLYTGPSANEGGTKGSNGKIVKGNNTLPVPVGLITSDEVVFAGGFGGMYNKGYWLYTNQYYWTMTPGRYPNASVFYVTDSGNLGYGGVHVTNTGARPVINIKANVEITGTGIDTDPYVIE